MNDEEKRRQTECLAKRGLPWEEAQRLVELTEAKKNGAIDSGELQKHTELMAELELILPCIT